MTLQLLFPFLLMLIAKRLAQFFKKCSRNPRDLKGSGATEIRSSAWLEHYTDNVGVSSSNLLGSTKEGSRIGQTMLRAKAGGLAQLARAPALQAGGRRFDSDILHTRTDGVRSKTLAP